MGGTTVSLFDGRLEESKRSNLVSRKRKETKIKGGSLPSKRKKTQEHGINDNKEHKVSRDERRRITAAYERGEITFDCPPDAFALCHCCMPPDYHRYPHPYHLDETATFELQSYAKRKR
jgi:hypothetical protein